MPRQSDLRYTFEPLRGDPFEVVSFPLEEGLSQPFKLELELVSHHPAIDFYRMLERCTHRNKPKIQWRLAKTRQSNN